MLHCDRPAQQVGLIGGSFSSQAAGAGPALMLSCNGLGAQKLLHEGVPVLLQLLCQHLLAGINWLRDCHLQQGKAAHTQRLGSWLKDHGPLACRHCLAKHQLSDCDL